MITHYPITTPICKGLRQSRAAKDPANSLARVIKFLHDVNHACDAVQVLVACTSSVSWYTRWEPLQWRCHVTALLLSFCLSVQESCTQHCSRCRTYSSLTTTRLTWYAGLDNNTAVIKHKLTVQTHDTQVLLALKKYQVAGFVESSMTLHSYIPGAKKVTPFWYLSFLLLLDTLFAIFVYLHTISIKYLI